MKPVPPPTDDLLATILAELGIPPDYAERTGLHPQPECVQLVATELDVFGRQPLLDVEAYRAWVALKTAAAADGIELQIVSAYRSIAYQQELIARKLMRGESIDDILKVNAAPGFSEHHSGRALVIGTPGYPFLEQEFEQSPAYAWLRAHASRFGFHLSFPAGNTYGVLYEPWHWCYRTGNLHPERRAGTVPAAQSGDEALNARE